jgi:hypothetical protein
MPQNKLPLKVLISLWSMTVPWKKVIIISLAGIILVGVTVAAMYHYERTHEGFVTLARGWEKEQFWVAFYEAHDIIVSFLEPITLRAPFPWEHLDESGKKEFYSRHYAMVVQYYLSSDSPNVLSSLDALYEQASEGHESSRDQRADVREIREYFLERMERAISDIGAAVEVARKYEGRRHVNVTPEDNRVLYHDIWWWGARGLT